MTIAPIQSKRIGEPVTGQARFERKFFIPVSKVALARHLLTHSCVKDRQHSRSLVNSIYYDTPDLDYFTESEEGNCRRHKVRFRWYDRPWEHGAMATAYLELKGKHGFTGTKTRQAFAIPSTTLARPRASARLISDTVLRQTLTQMNGPCQTLLQPVVHIAYDRLRYTHPLTELRLSLDWNIRSTLLSPVCSRQESLVTLSGAVMEIKGPNMTLPPTLDALRKLGTDWTRYSKYAGCLTTHFETAGTMGRLSPSGRIVTL